MSTVLVQPNGENAPKSPEADRLSPKDRALLQAEPSGRKPVVPPTTSAPHAGSLAPLPSDTRDASEAADDAADTFAYVAQDVLGGDKDARDVLAIAVTGKSFDDLEKDGSAKAFMDFVGDVAAKRIKPEVKVANRADGAGFTGKTDGNWLPADVNGAFVPGQDGAATILVAKDVKGPALRSTMLEEFGEAIGERARAAGVTVGDGDVGARLALLVGSNGAGALTNGNGALFQGSSADETSVVLDGVPQTAFAQSITPANATPGVPGYDPNLAYVPASENDVLPNEASVIAFMEDWGGYISDTGERALMKSGLAEALGVSEDTAGRLGQFFYPGDDRGYILEPQIRAMMADGIIPPDYQTGQPIKLKPSTLDGGRVANALINASGEVNEYFPASPDDTFNELQLIPMFEHVFTQGSISAADAREISLVALQFSPQRTTTGASMRDIKNFIDMGYINISLGDATTGPKVTTNFPADMTATAEADFPFVPPWVEQTQESESPQAHEAPGFWETLWGDITDPSQAISDIAAWGGAAEADVAKFLNGEMEMIEAAEKGMVEVFDVFIAEVQEGSATALAHLDQLGTAIKNGVTNLSAAGAAFVDNMVADAKELGSEVAIKTLAMTAGMTDAQAKEALETAGAKFEVMTHITSATPDELKGLIPNFDELYSKGIEMQREFFELPIMGGESGTEGDAISKDEMFSNIENRPSFRKLLAAEGMALGDDGVLYEGVAATPGVDAVAVTDEAKQNFYDKYMRIDLGADFGVSVSGPTASADTLGIRPFITMPRKDADGNEFIEFRFREIEFAGGSASLGSLGGDVGLVTTRDIVVPLYTSGPKAGQTDDVMYNATTAFIMDATADGKIVAEAAKDLFGLFGKNTGGAAGAIGEEIELADLSGTGTSMPAEAVFGNASTLPMIPEVNEGFGIPPTPMSTGARGMSTLPTIPEETTPPPWGISAEVGVGAGLTTSYNLSEMGNDAWQPFLAEVAGAVVGGVATGGLILAADVATDGALTPFIEQWGDTAVHGGAMLGSMVADIAMAETHEDASLSGSVFGWGAGLLAKKSTGGTPIGLAADIRFQANISRSWDI